MRKNIQKPFTFIVASLLIIGFAGCASTKHNSVPAKPIKADVRGLPQKPVYRPIAADEGSLWTDNSGSLYFVDTRARRVGDVITIDIVENTSSKMDANTKAGRTSSIDGSIDNSLGYMRALQEANRRLGLNLDATASNTLFKATLKNEFDGKGTSDRSGQVTASIGARVTEVLPNGNLVVFGKRKMKVNNETQIITVSGIIRPADIDTDNRIKSTYIADALIEYTGQGVIAEKQKPGWGSRVVDIIWPF